MKDRRIEGLETALGIVLRVARLGGVITEEDKADCAIAEAILHDRPVPRDAVLVKVREMNRMVRESGAADDPEVAKNLESIDGLMKFVGIPTEVKK